MHVCVCSSVARHACSAPNCAIAVAPLPGFCTRGAEWDDETQVQPPQRVGRQWGAAIFLVKSLCCCALVYVVAMATSYVRSKVALLCMYLCIEFNVWSHVYLVCIQRSEWRALCYLSLKWLQEFQTTIHTPRNTQAVELYFRGEKMAKVQAEFSIIFLFIHLCSKRSCNWSIVLQLYGRGEVVVATKPEILYATLVSIMVTFP